MAAAHLSLASGLTWLSSGPPDDGRGAEAFQIVGLRRLAGGGDDAEAALLQERYRDAPDAACRAGDKHLARFGRDAALFDRHDAEHRGVAGGADRHRLALAQSFGQADQPVGLDACLLRQAAPVLFADAPAVENDLRADGKAVACRLRHRAGEIDARHHRELPHHRRLAGDGEAVLVVDGRIGDGDRHIALRQPVLLDPLDAGALPGLVFFNQDRIDHVCSNSTVRAAQSSLRRLPSIKSSTERAAASTLVPGPNTAATPWSSKN